MFSVLKPNSCRILLAGLLLWSVQVIGQQKPVRWQEAPFTVVSPTAKTFKTAEMGHVFRGQRNCLVRIPAELTGLTGVQMPKTGDTQPLTIQVSQPVQVLIGLFRDSTRQTQPATLLNRQPVLTNGVTVTGMPRVDVYALPYGRGRQVIQPTGEPFLVLGVIKGNQTLSPRDAGYPDGRLWEPYIVEGFSDEEPLFEIVGGPDTPVVANGMPGTEGIQGGFEGGACIKLGNTYHMFPTERAGEQGMPAYYDRIKTRIGHWTSTDAIHWTRQSTIYQASGVYAVTDDDNPINDRRGAIWSYMPVFNEKTNRWNGFYLAYTCHKTIHPNHSFGRIWRCESVKEGMDGIGGPYRDLGIVMEPGLDSQLWEGRQGVDSFFPYKVGDKWLSLYGGAFPWAKWADYPDKPKQGWLIGLAQSNTLEGPWVRMDTTINPVRSMHPWFIENPLISRLPNGLYIAMFDGGPDDWGLHLPNMFGYSLSQDGIHWTEAHYFPIHTKVKKWWDIMRTPLCLIPEGNDEFTVVYAAIDKKQRYHPMGMVRVKLNTRIADAKLKQLSK
nr:hypothetical protein [uncultured Arsenicibacter sp.]